MQVAQQTSLPSSSAGITREDIELLVREPSVAMRGRIVQKIASGYNSGTFSDGESKLACEIFRLLLKDTEMKIRKLMAEELKSNLQVPHDVIWALANDHHEVATPVLQHSHVLSEDDLMLIVRATRDHPKLHAIAKRESVSKELSHALVETRDHEVAKLILSNHGATIGETTMQAVLEEFARDNSVLEEMVLRGGLPYGFAEQLFSAVSDTLKKQLTKKYRLTRHVVDDAVNGARETAMLQFISPWMSQQEITALVEQMHRNKRLTDSVMIRSLCIGDLRFFEAAIAKRIGIPAANARILMIDPGPLGFKALYESSGLPLSYYPAIQTMLRLALEETEYGAYRTSDFGAKMIERITSAGYDQTIEHMSTILTMIGRAIHETPTIH